MALELDNDNLPQLDRHEYDNLVRVSELTREAYVLTSDYISLEEAFLRASVAKVLLESKFRRHLSHGCHP